MAFDTYPNPDDTEQQLLRKLVALQLNANSGGVILGSNGTALSVKRAFQLCNASADTEIVPAVSGKQIRVLSVVVLADSSATFVTFKSASTAIFCPLANGANGGVVLPRNTDGWFETLSGQALVATLSAGSNTGIAVNYVEV